jgi:hypothetical protein
MSEPQTVETVVNESDKKQPSVAKQKKIEQTKARREAQKAKKQTKTQNRAVKRSPKKK